MWNFFRRFYWWNDWGWTQPNLFGMGRCYRPIKQWISPLFTYNVNSGEDDVDEEEGGGRGGGSWPTAAHGAAGGGGKTPLLTAVEVPTMTVLTISSPVFFLCFPSLLLLSSFFLSRFSPLYPYSAPLFFLSLSLFSFSFSSVFSSPLGFFSFSYFPLLFALSSPVFIGKNRGGGLLPLPNHGVGVGWPGRPLCSRPKTT